VNAESNALSAEDRARLRDEIAEAGEPVAQFWPMKAFVHHNPIHGLEHLPFDEAVRCGKRLLGGNGYLPNEEYRALYCEGRITDEAVRRAFERVGAHVPGPPSIQVGSREICASEVMRLQLLFEFYLVEPAALPWQFDSEGAIDRCRHDLPSESRRRIIQQIGREAHNDSSHPERTYVTELWNGVLAVLGLSDPLSSSHLKSASDCCDTSGARHASTDIDLPAQRTLSDWLEQLADVSVVDRINEQLVKWIAAFVDEGLAGWGMPSRSAGFYAAWRDLARYDRSERFLGVRNFVEKVDALPEEPEEAIVWSLQRLRVPSERRQDYLSRMLAQLPGWTGLIRWMGDNPDYPAQQRHPIDAVQYLAVRLFYEVELVQLEARRQWGIEGTVPAIVGYWHDRRDEYAALVGHASPGDDPNAVAVGRDGWRLFHLAQFLELSPEEVRGLSRDDVHTLLGWLDGFPPERHGPVWLEAYEGVYRDDVVGKLLAHRGQVPEAKGRPRAQAVFCIDVRSESYRRHLEAQGGYETLGFAGFFGVPISHRVFDTAESVALCPVLLKPAHAVAETPRAGQDGALQRYASGTRWQRIGDHLFHDLKQHPIASFILIDVLGFLFGLGLVGKTLLRRPYQAIVATVTRWFAHPVPTEIPIDSIPSPADGSATPQALARGFTLVEQATFVENGLRTMGLTRNFGRFVVLCGHGSLSDNNPYGAALDCGACGGRPGDPNARIFAAMGNSPEVRRLLKERGLAVPEDTWFLAGKHNTNTDRVTLYDVEDVPARWSEELRELRRDLEQAGAHQALERCHRIPKAPRDISSAKAYAHVEMRSVDWANPRPEWGLASNAAFLVGRRALSKGLDLEGRVFLHSYDPEADPEGAILEKIMTAPLIVGEWISMEHYFSGVDPWAYGSGNKVLHNVVSGVGLMLGRQSDLQTGLPLQTVNNGAIHHHEPMRLLTIIEAVPQLVESIVRKHELLQQLFHNQWVNLVALDPHSFDFHRYNPDGTWERMAMTAAAGN